MEGQLKLELISPEKTAVSKLVVMVGVPGEDGLYGVLAGHTPMVTSMAPGVVEIYEKNETEVTERYFVVGGFAEIYGEKCVLMADKIYKMSELKVDQVREEEAALAQALYEAETDEARTSAQKGLVIVRAKLSALEA